MRRFESSGAFSLVELLVALAAASILLLTFGIMLTASFSAMTYNRQVIDGQRDVTAALQAIDHLVRPASRYGIAVSTNRVTVSREAGSATVYSSGDDLMMDPDAGSPANAIPLVRGRLEAFEPSLSGSNLRLLLRTVTGTSTTVVQSTIAFRNSP